MWWIVTTVVAWSQVSSLSLPGVTSLTQTKTGLCLFAYNDTNVYSYYSLDYGVIDPAPYEYTGSTDMAVAKNGNATVWMDSVDNVTEFYVYDLKYTLRLHFVARASPLTLYTDGVKVAMDQTGDVVAMTDSQGNVYVQEWHNNAWHNVSSSFTVPNVLAFGHLLRVVSYENTVVVATTYVEDYDSYSYVCVNNTEWNCTIMYISDSGINMDMSDTGDDWIMAIGDYSASEGGVLNSGVVVVKGAHNASIAGTDITTGFGSAVAITADWLAVASLGPSQYVIVYQRIDSHYHRVQTVPISEAVNYITFSEGTLVVISEYHALFYRMTTSSPTSSPTWYPTVGASTNETETVVAYSVAVVMVLFLGFLVMRHLFQRHQYRLLSRN